MRFRQATVCLAGLVAAMLLATPLATAPDSLGTASASTNTTLAAQEMAAMPLAFTENRGQWNDSVLFRTSAGGATVWFRRDGIYYKFDQRAPRGDTTARDPMRMRGRKDPIAGGTEPFMASAVEPDSIEMVMVKAAFVQANPAVEITGENRLAYRCSYFLAGC